MFTYWRDDQRNEANSCLTVPIVIKRKGFLPSGSVRVCLRSALGGKGKCVDLLPGWRLLPLLAHRRWPQRSPGFTAGSNASWQTDSETLSCGKDWEAWEVKLPGCAAVERLAEKVSHADEDKYAGRVTNTQVEIPTWTHTIDKCALCLAVSVQQVNAGGFSKCGFYSPKNEENYL